MYLVTDLMLLFDSVTCTAWFTQKDDRSWIFLLELNLANIYTLKSILLLILPKLCNSKFCFHKSYCVQWFTLLIMIIWMSSFWSSVCWICWICNIQSPDFKILKLLVSTYTFSHKKGVSFILVWLTREKTKRLV